MHKPKLRCTSANSPTRCSCTVICWHHWLLPWHHSFFTIRKLTLRTNEIKDRELLTNQIVVYTRLTYVKPYQNIFERFWTKLKPWRIWLTDQSYLRIMLKASYPDQQDSTIWLMWTARFSVHILLLHHYMSDLAHLSDFYSLVIGVSKYERGAKIIKK